LFIELSFDPHSIQIVEHIVQSKARSCKSLPLFNVKGQDSIFADAVVASRHQRLEKKFDMVFEKIVKLATSNIDVKGFKVGCRCGD
jgi:hypothetical protein